jgi:hypothetical protein
MTEISSARDRLAASSDLAGVLDAAYDVFEGLLPVIRTCHDHAGRLFAAFRKSAASAAEGRNAILLAPSLPSRCLHQALSPDEDSHRDEDAEGVAADLAAVSLLVADRLVQAARSAPDYRDRAACRSAARRAREIHALFAKAGQ